MTGLHVELDNSQQVTLKCKDGEYRAFCLLLHWGEAGLKLSVYADGETELCGGGNYDNSYIPTDHAWEGRNDLPAEAIYLDEENNPDPDNLLVWVDAPSASLFPED